MRIAMIGGGYVGLVSAACFAEFGVDVAVAVAEEDETRLAARREGRLPISEPGLDRLVAANVAAGRLSFGVGLKASVAGAEAVFIAVGTPSRDGDADLSHVFAAAEQVAASLSDYAVMVIKSTVPVGTGRRIDRIVRPGRPDHDFDVASNPEFLREGSAIGDFLRPTYLGVGRGAG